MSLGDEEAKTGARSAGEDANYPRAFVFSNRARLAAVLQRFLLDSTGSPDIQSDDLPERLQWAATALQALKGTDKSLSDIRSECYSAFSGRHLKKYRVLLDKIPETDNLSLKSDHLSTMLVYGQETENGEGKEDVRSSDAVPSEAGGAGVGAGAGAGSSEAAAVSPSKDAQRYRIGLAYLCCYYLLICAERKNGSGLAKCGLVTEWLNAANRDSSYLASHALGRLSLENRGIANRYRFASAGRLAKCIQAVQDLQAKTVPLPSEPAIR